MNTSTQIATLAALLGYSAAFAGSTVEWSEIGDAPTFPHGFAQMTRGPGSLTSITGATSSGDLQDSYCVKISDPDNFYITTDSDIDPLATASFDTRLFLFDRGGRPLLYNDDTPPSASPFASSLINLATDGSGFALGQPGEYVLVITGFAEDPMDVDQVTLFDQDDVFDLIHAADPSAGRFFGWGPGTGQSGSYTMRLAGISPCQNELDIIGYESGIDTLQACSGDSTGAFPLCRSIRTDYAPFERNFELIYLDDDAQVDIVIGGVEPAAAVSDTERCLGDSSGAFDPCASIDNGVTRRVYATHALYLNDDDLIDIVYSSTFPAGVRACLGDGLGAHPQCSEIDVEDDPVAGVTSAYLTPDRHIDLVITQFEGVRICANDGSGGFPTCQLIELSANKAAIADLNEDGHLDFVLALEGAADQICLNDGMGRFSCAPIDSVADRSRDLVLLDVNQDGHVDAVMPEFNGAIPGRNELCLGDGTGTLTCSDFSIAGQFASVAAGLLNGDSFVDLVFGDFDLTRVCLGDGQGGFTCSDDPSRPFRQVGLVELGQISDDLFADGFE